VLHLTWDTLYVLTIRGESKAVSGPQEPNTCCIRLAAQAKASSHFFLFGYIKGKLSDYNCGRWEDLLNAITEIFSGVDQGGLLSVSKSWANWIKWVTKHDGEYSTK
jgi:hypothetical protein